MQLYETIFIVTPESDETTLQETIQSVQTFIESNGGVVKHADSWGRKRLAYEVDKHNEGYFVFMIFEATPTLVTELQRRYRLMEPIIKFIVVLFEGDLNQPQPSYRDSSSQGTRDADTDASDDQPTRRRRQDSRTGSTDLSDEADEVDVESDDEEE